MAIDFAAKLEEDRKRYLFIDYETRSKADLKKTGAYEYARHPSTRILCVAWQFLTGREVSRIANGFTKIDPSKTKSWSPYRKSVKNSNFNEFISLMLDASVIIVAHNAAFEQLITRYVLPRYYPLMRKLPHERFMCTASMARALALPAKLEGVCDALELPVRKDKNGHKLMLKLSKPRKPSKNNPSRWHKIAPDLERLIDYCKTDVDAEIAVFCAIPKLIPVERELWLIDQKINFRGFKADRFLVKRIIDWITEEHKRFRSEVERLTDGELQSTNQGVALIAYLKKLGVSLPDIKAKTVSDALSSGLASGKAKSLLEIRSNASKTSVKKFWAFEIRSRFDGRVRENQIYHGASTGRFNGAGLQPLNMPKNVIWVKNEGRDTEKLVNFAIKVLSDPDTDLELIRLLFGNPLDVFVSVARAMICASKGKKLFGGDFAGIEVRILFWIANHKEGLRAFREGRDLYVEQACDIYQRTITKKDDDERQLGKKVILGAGFGLGKGRFQASCLEDGIEISDELAAKAINAYRTTHAPVKKLWGNLERAAIAAVKNPGKRYTINHTTWYVADKFLWCVLPSGRKLAYYNPRVKMRMTPWKVKRETLHHWDNHPKTKKWVEVHTWGGTLTENVVQAVARDCMTESMPRAEAAGYELLFTPHDELLAEKANGSIKEFEGLMDRVPKWGAGIPLKVEGKVMDRYEK